MIEAVISEHIESDLRRMWRQALRLLGTAFGVED